MHELTLSDNTILCRLHLPQPKSKGSKKSIELNLSRRRFVINWIAQFVSLNIELILTPSPEAPPFFTFVIIGERFKKQPVF